MSRNNQTEKEADEDQMLEVETIPEREASKEGEGEFEGEVDTDVKYLDRLKFAFHISIKGSKKAGQKMARMFMALIAVLAMIAGAVLTAVFYLYSNSKNK